MPIKPHVSDYRNWEYNASMELNKENLKYLPLVAIGLGMAAAELLVRPFIQNKAEQVQKMAEAAITYYSSSEHDQGL